MLSSARDTEPSSNNILQYAKVLVMSGSDQVGGFMGALLVAR